MTYDQQQQPPITPSRELVNEWLHKPEFAQPGLSNLVTITTNKINQICADATQWGYDQRGKVNEAELQEARDQELEACCEWLDRIAYRQSLHIRGSHLRAARRPKPPSLKEQALMALEDGDTGPGASLTPTEVSIIRRALEALPDD